MYLFLNQEILDDNNFHRCHYGADVASESKNYVLIKPSDREEKAVGLNKHTVSGMTYLRLVACAELKKERYLLMRVLKSASLEAYE